MNKKLAAIKKQIETTEGSRSAFIAKFEASINSVNSEIEQCQTLIQQAIAADDFDAFERESNKLTLLQAKKKKYEDGMADAEAAAVGDYEAVRAQIVAAVKEAAESKLKPLVQNSAAILRIAEEIEELRNDANSLIGSISRWTDQPVLFLGMDVSADVQAWACCVDVPLYKQTAAKHPEWIK